MSKKIITTDEKKPVLKIIVLVSLVIIAITMTFILLNNKKESEDSSNEKVATINPVDKEEIESNEDLVDNTEETTDPNNEVSVVEDNTEDTNKEEEENLEPEANEENLEEVVEPVEQWETSKNGPRNPETDIELNEEQIARSKTGGYYDGAYVSLDKLVSSIGSGSFTELPEGIPRFYNIEKELQLAQEVEKPTPGSELVSALTIETLEFIDKNVDRTDDTNSSRLYEDHFKSNITKNLDAFRAASENSMRTIKEATGVIADEKFYEQLITSDIHSTRNRLFSEAREEDHKYKEALRASILSAKMNGKAVPEYETHGAPYMDFYDGIGHWLENGGKYTPKSYSDPDYTDGRPINSSFASNNILYEDFSNPKVLIIGHDRYTNSEGEVKDTPYVYVLVNNDIYQVKFKLDKENQSVNIVLR